MRKYIDLKPVFVQRSSQVFRAAAEPHTSLFLTARIRIVLLMNVDRLGTWLKSEIAGKQNVDDSEVGEHSEEKASNDSRLLNFERVEEQPSLFNF